jgi:light-regulated signal transduction histidine kinase (bacteriophytochrome)
MLETLPTEQAVHLAKLQSKLDALQAEMQEFTYTVSHDLRAPLRHIVSYAQLVREDAGPQLTEEVQGFLNTICDSAHTMGVMLDRLLELSRVGTAVLQVDAVPLQALVQEVVDGVQAAHPERSIVWNLAADLPPVWADAALLEQAVRQVIANAVQFTVARTPAVIAISAVTDASNGTVTLVVQDNGIGFNPALVEQLFHPFKRLHNARQGAGLGTGLALTRKVMERLSGTAVAQGVVDGGCTVLLTLPKSAH